MNVHEGPHLFARRGPDVAAGALALVVHGVFFLLLVFGVSWQTQHPAPVMVDLWEALPEPLPPAPPVMPPSVPEPAPAPEPVVKEVIPPKAPDIALEKKKVEAEQQKKFKQALEAEQKALAEAARVEAEQIRKARDQEIAAQQKREALKRMEEEDLQQKLMNEELASETRQIKQLESRVAASKRAAEVARSVGQYKDMISAKVRGNTRLPDNLKGNPQVKCLVKLLPTGEVLDVRVIQGSGNTAYDDAVERAIRKSSPLPLPEDRDARAAFVPEVTLVHRPRE
jgi:colicin import membrane protein